MPLMIHSFMTLIFSLLCLSSLTISSPLKKKDVFDPQILSPSSSTVWAVGDSVTVEWNTSNAPADLSNPIGMVVLGIMANGSENLNLDNPLAANFSILDGNVSFVVPLLPTRTDYIIVLFGDSGNASPEFTITNSTSVSLSSSSSGASSSATASAGASSSSASFPAPSSPSSSVVVVTVTTSSTGAAALPSSLTPPISPTPSLIPIAPPTSGSSGPTPVISPLSSGSQSSSSVSESDSSSSNSALSTSITRSPFTTSSSPASQSLSSVSGNSNGAKPFGYSLFTMISCLSSAVAFLTFF